MRNTAIFCISGIKEIQYSNIIIYLLIVIFMKRTLIVSQINGPRQANLLLIAYASSEGSGEPAHPRSLARTFAARSYKQ